MKYNASSSYLLNNINFKVVYQSIKTMSRNNVSLKSNDFTRFGVFRASYLSTKTCGPLGKNDQNEYKNCTIHPQIH